MLTKRVSILQQEVSPRTVFWHTSKRMVAELLGTMILVVYSAGLASTVMRTEGALSYGSQAACAGAGLAAVIFGMGRISGAHLNPAITFAFWVRRDIQFGLAVVYWIAQFLGGFAAAGVLAALWGRSNPFGIGANVPVDLNYGQAFLMEGIAAMVLALVTVGAAERGAYVGAQVALAAGAAYAAGSALAAPYGGGSLNPARSLATAALQPGAMKYAWIYVGAPFAAAIVTGVILYLISERISYNWQVRGVTGVEEVDIEGLAPEPTLQPMYSDYKRQGPHELSDPFLRTQYVQETRSYLSPGTTGTTIPFHNFQRGGVTANEV